MRANLSVTDKYVLAVTGLLMGTSAVFAWYGETRLDLCLSIYIIEVLVINQVSVSLSSRARECTGRVGYVLVACFAVIVIAAMVRIIAG